MITLARLRKSLLVSLITLSLLLNLSIGLVIVFIWHMIVGFKKMSDLLKTGTSATATVVRVETSVARSITIGSPKRTTSRTIYRLVANWQHPQTGKTYTLTAPISHPNRFPVGSSVNFFVNYDDPRFYSLADVSGAFTPLENNQSPSQDA